MASQSTYSSLPAHIPTHEMASFPISKTQKPTAQDSSPNVAIIPSETFGRLKRFERSFRLAGESSIILYLRSLAVDTHVLACNVRCQMHGPSCNAPRTTFLSTRNSRRSSHAYLFLLTMFGSSLAITDHLLKEVRKLLRPICSLGLRYNIGYS